MLVAQKFYHTKDSVLNSWGRKPNGQKLENRPHYGNVMIVTMDLVRFLPIRKPKINCVAHLISHYANGKKRNKGLETDGL